MSCVCRWDYFHFFYKDMAKNQMGVLDNTSCSLREGNCTFSRDWFCLKVKIYDCLAQGGRDSSRGGVDSA
jgi:hypothetical protein